MSANVSTPSIIKAWCAAWVITAVMFGSRWNAPLWSRFECRIRNSGLDLPVSAKLAASAVRARFVEPVQVAHVPLELALHGA